MFNKKKKIKEKEIKSQPIDDILNKCQLTKEEEKYVFNGESYEDLNSDKKYSKTKKKALLSITIVIIICVISIIIVTVSV
ncbi:MAG: hypothetical protein RR549_07405, partial [Oscillospiraceae bacterium]